MGKYDDIINLPHPVSRKRPQMPLEDRAAQFAPFAAVVGHEASIHEAARLTEKKRELDEAEKSAINEQLREVQNKIRNNNHNLIRSQSLIQNHNLIHNQNLIHEQNPLQDDQNSLQSHTHTEKNFGIEIEVEYFIADTLKSGGSYVVRRGKVKRIDEYERCVCFIDGTLIKIDDVVKIVIL